MPLAFSAALLAGGRSRRMGRDKALLPVEGHGTLWQRQLAVIESLAPQRIYWSGPPREGLPAHLIITPDEVNDAGPLAGISRCLDAVKEKLLLVLAIDLPAMSAEYLRCLLTSCADNRGVVPRRNGRYEPLTAVYPKALRELARAHLTAGELALQDLAAAGRAHGLLEALEVAEADAPLFRNLNRPNDLAS